MMEGVSGEAASLAGHLKLSNLCWIYDSNRITIEGETSLTFSEDVAARFTGYGWNIIPVSDANDLEAIDRAFITFSNTNDRPTLIILDSHIAYGSPNKQDKNTAHGEPLGEEEIKLTKRNYGWPEDAEFLVPDEVREHFRTGIGKRGPEQYKSWEDKLREYTLKYPDLAEHLNLMQKRGLPKGWDEDLPVFPADPKGVATRVSSGKVLNAAAKNIPWLMGGSADLAPSTKTELTYEHAGVFTAEHRSGRNFHFGIREHAMASILNGMSVSKIRPYGATFFVFSDYSRPAIRLGAMMEIPVIHIFTHDSIGVGEDGPTHQPVEHIASLRAIPGLIILRPADANEVVEAWRVIMQLRNESAALILTRQALPTLDRSQYAPASGLARGAYILAGSEKSDPDIILLASGSEVPLCIDAFKQLSSDGINARVVSMPSWELFEKQSREYRDQVLPPSVTSRLAVEQASTMGWAEYTGLRGRIIGMRSFGASAPLKSLRDHFGFTTENVVKTAKAMLE